MPRAVECVAGGNCTHFRPRHAIMASYMRRHWDRYEIYLDVFPCCACFPPSISFPFLFYLLFTFFSALALIFSPLQLPLPHLFVRLSPLPLVSSGGCCHLVFWERLRLYCDHGWNSPGSFFRQTTHQLKNQPINHRESLTPPRYR